MGGCWATWNGERTTAGRFHFHFSDNSSSPPPSEQLFNSQAAAAVEGGPCSTCAKSFQHLSTIVSEEEGKVKSDIFQENTFGTKKTKRPREMLRDAV